MVRRQCVMALMGVFAIACASHAEDPSFEGLDANHDGVLSESETANADIDFTKADTNEDGTLDQGEYDAAVG